MSKEKGLVGTATYASLNAHNRIRLSRRDDIESLAYMLIDISLENGLPWNSHDEEIMITNHKESIDVMKLVEGLPEELGVLL